MDYVIIGMGSGRLNYGGVAINVVRLYHYMKNINCNVVAILSSPQNICEHVDETFIHCGTGLITRMVDKYITANTIIILRSWISMTLMAYLKRKKCKTLLFNPGVMVDSLNTFYFDTPNVKTYLCKTTIDTMTNVDQIYVNSILTQSIVKEYIKKDSTLFYFSAIPLKKNIIDWNKKEMDIIFIASSLERQIKNYELFEKIIGGLQNNKLKICIVGENKTKMIPQNVIYIGEVTQEQAIELISKSKMVINTSFFDSCPTTLFEAIVSGTKYICSKNVGGSELLPKEYIVDDYKNVEAWMNTINKEMSSEFDRELLNVFDQINVNVPQFLKLNVLN